eukprot:TRINITY_DN4422_c0_g1_i1.p1 TRINITY_DN4422_c0_g1~~TRINITY_DN4422_c0_g1_i1.p1  ORF type:complete len:1410 (+),score=299.58 TRINITY_DN4422_c0_g1_i1:193-4230(+)
MRDIGGHGHVPAEPGQELQIRDASPGTSPTIAATQQSPTALTEHVPGGPTPRTTVRSSRPKRQAASAAARGRREVRRQPLPTVAALSPDELNSSAKLGLSSVEAKQILQRELSQLVAAQMSAASAVPAISLAAVVALHREQSMHRHTSMFVGLGLLLLIISAAIDDRYRHRLILELCLILAAFALSLTLDLREAYWMKTELARRLQGILAEVEKRDELCEEVDLYTASSSSAPLVTVCRGAWCKISPLLLVEGDVIELSPGDEAPADIRQLDTDLVLKKSERFAGESRQPMSLAALNQSHGTAPLATPVVQLTGLQESGALSVRHVTPAATPHRLPSPAPHSSPAFVAGLSILSSQSHTDALLEFDASTTTDIYAPSAGLTSSAGPSITISSPAAVLGPPTSQNTTGLGSAAALLGATGGRFSASFRVLRTPVIDTLASGFAGEFKRPLSPLEQLQVNILFRRKYIMWGVFALAILVNIMRYFIHPIANRWTDTITLRPFYTLLPLLPLSVPLLFKYMRTVGDARLLALFEHIEQKAGTATDTFDDDNAEKEVQQSADVAAARVWHYVKELWAGDPLSLSHLSRPLDTLGSTTVWCFLDKNGILSHADPSPEQVLFFNEASEEPVSLSMHSSANFLSDHFEDQEYDRYISSLKPIGLSILISTCCEHTRQQIGAMLAHYRRWIALSDPLLATAHPADYNIECLCPLPVEIGFSPEVVTRFARGKNFLLFLRPKISGSASGAVSELLPVPFIASLVVHDTVAPNQSQLFSRGTPDLTLSLCDWYWDGKKLCPLTQKVFTSLMSTYQQWSRQDFVVLALSYKPLDKSQESEIEVYPDPYVTVIESVAEWKDDVKNILHGQIFLGFVGLRYAPNRLIIQSIEEMHTAGVRFVYFSSAHEVKTLAFGEKLGLETHWNACINLNEKQQETMVKTDLKARMPKGTAAVRDHLENVDNVPLLVHIFAGCQPQSVREMIKIFQEYGEVVCTVGSSFNPENMHTFAQSNISFALNPVRPLGCRKSKLKIESNRRFTDQSSSHHHHDEEEGETESESSSEPDTVSRILQIAPALNGLPCYLLLPDGVRMSDLLAIMKECRHILFNMKQSLTFALCCHAVLLLLVLFASVLYEPALVTGLQQLWVIWIVVPVLSVSYISTPTDPDLMKLFAAKNTGRIHDISRFLSYFVARFLPTVAFLLYFFAICFDTFWPRGGKETVWDAEMHNTPHEVSALAYSQSVTLFFLVYYIITFSMGFLHRTESLLVFRPHHNKRWCAVAVGLLVLQVGMSGSIIAAAPVALSLLELPPLPVAAACLWPIWIVCVDEAVKSHDRKQFKRFQKRLILEFNTKLGMHSPV